MFVVGRLSMAQEKVSVLMSFIFLNEMVRGRINLDSERLILKVMRKWSVYGSV